MNIMLPLHKITRSHTMPLKNRMISLLMLVSLLMSLSSFAPALCLSDDKKDKDKEKKEKKEKKAEKMGAEDSGKPRPVLWQEPADIESRDLFYGLGGAEGAPNASETFKFIRRDTG